MAVKTVTCPECQAQQAILREEDGGMHCAFCGAQISDLPPYEEGESLDSLVANEPVKIDPVGEAIQAKYVLTRDEVEAALVHAGKLKAHSGVTIVETVLLAIISVIQLLSVIFGLTGMFNVAKPTLSSYLFLVVFVGLIPVVWIMPKRTNKRIVERSTSGNHLTISVYENLVDVYIEEDDNSWQLEFEKDQFHFSAENGIQIVELADGRLLAVPVRGYDSPEQAECAAQRLQEAEEQYLIAHPEKTAGKKK